MLPANIITLAQIWLPRFLEVVLVLLLAWVGAGLLVDTHNTDDNLIANNDDNSDIIAVDVRPLLAHALFGEKPAVPISKPVEVIPPPQLIAAPPPTRRNIKLRGVIQAGEHSAAFVEVAGKQKMVRMGEEVDAGAVLKAVRARAIILDVNGTLETVEMAKSNLGGKGGAIPSSIPISSTNNPMMASRSMGGGSRRLSRAMLNRELRNLSGLMTQAQVVPYLQGGQTKGFIINNIAPGSLYARLGLRNHDIIQSINGVAITSPEQAMQMYQSLKNTPKVDIVMQRNGRPQRMQFDIR
ncbi:MAG: type II secretion system protein N [Mariprofundales bacterium]